MLFLYSIFLALTQKHPSGSRAVQNPAANTLTVPAQGGTQQVFDFTKSPARVDGDTTVIAENNNYSIVYFTADQSFLITILSDPAQAGRIAAEQELLVKLNVTQDEACKLKVALTVPAGVDEQLAGKDYGLSFCPSGQPF